MNIKVRFFTSLMVSVLLFCPFVGFTAEPPAGTTSFTMVKSGKPKFKPSNYSTFLTFNVENIQFQRSDPFFHYQNLAYGLKIGTMRNTGWYLSVMSNFNFNGLFNAVDANSINYLTKSTNSYFDGLFGLTFRQFKPVSFHLGLGYHYRTTNYKSFSGSWGRLPSVDAHGPMAAAGFMFHMAGFVLTAEAIANYNLKAPDFKDGLGVGIKMGIGFCLEHKKSAKKSKKKVSDKMSASEFHFSPTTAGPDEYDVVFRHSYTKPKPEIVVIIEKDTLLSKLPQPEYFNTSRLEEELLAEDPVRVTEPVPTKQEEAISLDNNPLNAAPADKPADVQQGEQPELKQETQPEKHIEKQSEKQLEKQPEKRPEKQSADFMEQQLQESSQKSDPLQKESVEKEVIVDTFVMSSAPVPPCTALMVKDIDGNTYHTLAIGNQCWLRENLRTTRFANGDSIKLGQSFDFKHAVRYCPGGDSSNVEEYGYLYNWNAVAQSVANNGNQHVQGMCPNGWHIPTMTEWENLFGYLAGQTAMNCQGEPQNVSKALASKTGWAASEMDCAIGNRLSLNNVSGFHALPAGMFFGKYDFFGKVARFWSSTVSQAQGKCDVYMSWDEAVVKKSDQEPAVVGFSVRCLKN